MNIYYQSSLLTNIEKQLKKIILTLKTIIMKKKFLLKRIYTECPGENFLIKQEAWSTKIGRFFGIPLARALAKSPIQIHPNIISILSVPFAVLAGFFFFKNMLIYGAILFFINAPFRAVTILGSSGNF